jgi:hypothetical protein
MTPKLIVRDIALSERPVSFHTPFRFGAVTVQGAPQLFVHAEIEVEGRVRAKGAAAELIVPKWFNKDPALTAEETVAQLRRSTEIARDIYLSEPRLDTAFGIHAACTGPQLAACAQARIPPLAALFGPAEIDKAIVDALLRNLGLDAFSGFARNVIGLDARLTADLDDTSIERFLAGRSPATQMAIRHTTGLTDPIEQLRDVVQETGCRFFKIKLSGDPHRDRDRLARIAAELAAPALDYRVTVDANEQYGDPANLAALVEALRGDRALHELAQRLLYIEQPLPREVTWDLALGDMGRDFAFIIDEADDGYGAFPRARALGYRGVSSKACKGLYKSLLNGVRAARANESDGVFIAAEDLTCQPGLAVQQDTALVAFLGIAHAERNGHHYVDGFADTPDAEADAFLAAHPDLYSRSEGRVRLAIRDGMIAIGSLACRGFACGVAPDRIGPRRNAGAATRTTAPGQALA